MQKQQNPFWWFIGLLLAVCIGVFAASLAWGSHVTPDSVEYLQQATNILTKGFCYSKDLSLPFDPFFVSLRPPGYSLFLMLTGSSFQISYVTLIAQHILFVIALLVVYKSTLGSLPAIMHLVLILASVLLFPVAISMCNYILSDALLMVVLTWAFVCMLYFLATQRAVFFLWAQILIAASVWIKPIMQYYWLLNLGFVLYLIIRHKKVYNVYVAALLLPLSVAIWSYRNYTFTGVWHYSSISMQVLPLHYAKDVLILEHGILAADSSYKQFEREQEAIPTFKGKFEFSHSYAYRVVSEHAPAFIIKHVRGLIAFFLDTGRYFLYQSYGYTPAKEVSILSFIDSEGWWQGLLGYFKALHPLETALMLLILTWNIVSFVALLIYPIVRTEAIELRIFTLSLVCYVANLGTFTNFARFKVAVFPTLVYILVRVVSYLLQLKSGTGIKHAPNNRPPY